MFDEEFFKAVGLEGASDQQKVELGEQLAETVLNRVSVRLSEVLTEEQLAGFTAASEQGDEQAFAYLEQIYPDYPILIQEEVEGVKAELSHDVASVQALLDGQADQPAADTDAS
jgi:hypothetical protein